MNLKEWFGSKKTKNTWVGIVLVLIVVAACLFASKGDPEKFAALMAVAWPYVMGALGLLMATNLGQSHIDAKLAEKGKK